MAPLDQRGETKGARAAGFEDEGIFTRYEGEFLTLSHRSLLLGFEKELSAIIDQEKGKDRRWCAAGFQTSNFPRARNLRNFAKENPLSMPFSPVIVLPYSFQFVKNRIEIIEKDYAISKIIDSTWILNIRIETRTR